jgi:hypothetical protein
MPIRRNDIRGQAQQRAHQLKVLQYRRALRAGRDQRRRDLPTETGANTAPPRGSAYTPNCSSITAATLFKKEQRGE